MQALQAQLGQDHLDLYDLLVHERLTSKVLQGYNLIEFDEDDSHHLNSIYPSVQLVLQLLPLIGPNFCMRDDIVSLFNTNDATTMTRRQAFAAIQDGRVQSRIFLTIVCIPIVTCALREFLSSAHNFDLDSFARACPSWDLDVYFFCFPNRNYYRLGNGYLHRDNTLPRAKEALIKHLSVRLKGRLTSETIRKRLRQHDAAFTAIAKRALDIVSNTCTFSLAMLDPCFSSLYELLMPKYLI